MVQSHSTSQMRDELTHRLSSWFRSHARDLPWRRNRDPYRIWVSEVMLQQTQVKTVIGYYERFLDRFPSIEVLADASLEEVLKAWEGLGYYARARHLHQAARRLMDSGSRRLPTGVEELRALPGIGAYTAGAIASIAFGQRVPALDGNARRVLCRLFAVRDDVTRSATQRRLENLARQLLPVRDAGTFNEALIELGATVCSSSSPSCPACPLVGLCTAQASGEQNGLPIRRPTRVVPHYEVAAAVTVRADGAVLVARRNIDEMLGGLWEFPGGRRRQDESLAECLRREMKEELDVLVEVGQRLAAVEHAYSHFRITLYAFWCRLIDGHPRCLDCAAFRWVAPSDLDELPMSVADRKIADVLHEGQADRGESA